MGSALVVALAKYGLLALLWIFVLMTLRTAREDLWGRTATVPHPERAEKRPPRRRGVPHQLVVTEGALQGTSLTLSDTPITLGRGASCTLVLADDYASSEHARLAPGDGVWTVEDLGSTNGTYLGKTRVTRPTVLPVNTPLHIGKTTLELRS